jgi:hypothetical protein
LRKTNGDFGTRMHRQYPRLRAGRLLSIGCRLHFEPHNLSMMDVHRKYGKVKTITAENEMKVESGVWQIDKKLSGSGPLMDLGIYCMQELFTQLTKAQWQ